jgi:hypothetical protein
MPRGPQTRVGFSIGPFWISRGVGAGFFAGLVAIGLAVFVALNWRNVVSGF